MAKLILGFAGEMASGKGTASKYVCEKYGASSHRFSTPLRDVLKRLHIEESRENLQEISTSLRKTFGHDLLAKVIFHDTQKDPKDVVVVDGVRRLDDIIHLRQLPHFKLVYVEVDIEKRYERITKRGENPDDNLKTMEQFKKDHEAETEVQIKGLKDYANYIIDNDGEIEDFYRQIDEIIAQNK